MESSTAQVLAELTQVQDLARKLSAHLNPSQIEVCRSLAREIVFSIETTISSAKSGYPSGEKSMLYSGRGQPLQSFHHQFEDKEQQIFPKKRKILPKWTNQVSVCAAGGAELPPDDGQSWRKYGQKDILGAKYPRAYYRCTHRKTQGCPAMKQVQRSYVNNAVFDVTYLGTHTCSNSLQQAASRSRLYEPQQISLFDQQNNWAQHQELQSCLKTESSDTENDLFCTSQNMDFGYLGSLDSALASPTGSSCLPWPPCEINSEGDSELAETISAATSATDSPTMDVEFMLEFGGMDPDMLFDTSIFFA